ncbi:hypothetical protein GGI16_008590, partial [Coemansia sp. S142-1]
TDRIAPEFTLCGSSRFPVTTTALPFSNIVDVNGLPLLSTLPSLSFSPYPALPSSITVVSEDRLTEPSTTTVMTATTVCLLLELGEGAGMSGLAVGWIQVEGSGLTDRVGAAEEDEAAEDAIDDADDTWSEWDAIDDADDA